MTKHAPSKSFIDVDPADLGRNWRETSEANVRVGNRSDLVARIAEAVNQRLARLPRVWAWQHESCNAADQHTAANEAATCDPLYSFLVTDNVPNANSFLVRVVSFPRTSAANANAPAYAAIDGGSNVERTPGSYGSANTVNTWLDAEYDQFEVTRGSSAGLDINRHLATHDGFTPVSVVIQDSLITLLDSNEHLMVRPAATSPGRPVVSGPMSDIRTALDTIRRYNMMIDCSWSAQRNADDGANWANVAESGRHGVVITNNVFVNLLDVNITTRDVNSPGIGVCAWRQGVGEETRPDGQKVIRNVRVLAACNAASNDSGYFNAMTNGGSNAVLVVSNAAPTWYNCDVFVNSFINSAENTARENRIDLFGRVANSDNDQLRLYAVSIEGKYYSL